MAKHKKRRTKLSCLKKKTCIRKGHKWVKGAKKGRGKRKPGHCAKK